MPKLPTASRTEFSTTDTVACASGNEQNMFELLNFSQQIHMSKYTVLKFTATELFFMYNNEFAYPVHGAYMVHGA